MSFEDFRIAFIEFGSERIPRSLLRRASISMVARTGINDIINGIDREMITLVK